MKTCLFCGAMISPHPIHRNTTGVCSDCGKERGMDIPEEIDNGRPKMKGKHMVIQKSKQQLAMEKRARENPYHGRY